MYLMPNSVAYTLSNPVQKLSERIKQSQGDKNIFEPKKSVDNKRQKSTFVLSRPPLLRG